MVHSYYTNDFYADLREETKQSAKEIVPLIIELIKPKSVIDVGCGEGIWLAAFEENGIKDILGIDGDYIDRNMLAIPADRFMPIDLKKPIKLKRQFDLVVCLEVAEHLPKETAEQFVDFLTTLGPIVLFSAAIPYQGGEQHVNEQWPDYWAALFKKKDYLVFDCIRKRVWDNDKVASWYAQNILLFAEENCLSDYPCLRQELEKNKNPSISMVHPKPYMHTIMHAMWMEMFCKGILELRRLIPPCIPYVVVDDVKFDIEIFDTNAVRFMEKEGSYWGPPKDDDTAIRELEKFLKQKIRFLVILWPAFWWLDYYKSFNNYIESRFRCVLRNDRLCVFDLQQKPETCAD